jgi:hypothetical protein
MILKYSPNGAQVRQGLNAVLIVGSAPEAVVVKNWDLSAFADRIVINNAWQLFEQWSYLIYPEDFPAERMPVVSLKASQKLITAKEFVPHQNDLGGFIYAGGTMAFTAGYWALGALKPDLIAYVGCDMVYTSENDAARHFYGHGTADPLRTDMTLQSLEAKSIRLMALANAQQCAVLNMSDRPDSRLVFPRIQISEISQDTRHDELLMQQHQLLDPARVLETLEVEKNLGYMVTSGRYWESKADFDPDKLKNIDAMWLSAKKSAT